MEKRLGPIYAEQFAEEIKRLRGLAEQMELARKARNRAEMLAGNLMPDAPTEAQPQQTNAVLATAMAGLWSGRFCS